jgi:hypothetical protein
MRFMYKSLLERWKKGSLSLSSESGFTMTDLMVGAGLTALMVAGGGTAIASMVDASTTSNAKSERRVEMNRALEFVSTEVQRASGISDTLSLPSELSTELANGSTGINTSTVTPVLQLTLPGGNDKVTYFTADPVNGSWRGPKVLYRWGPSFAADGSYVNPGDASAWETVPLLDRLNGFTASVSGRSVQLNPTGQIKKLLGRQESYAVSLNTGVKSNFVASTSFSPVSGALGSVASTPLFTRVVGDLVVNRAATMKIDFLGGEITCGAGGPKIPTTAKVALAGGTSKNTGWQTPSGSLSYDVASNTTLNIEGRAKGDNSSGSCKKHDLKYNSKDNQGTQVLTLVNGDVVPGFRPLPGQRSIDAFMQSYIDPTTGRVKLAANQAIFLYELGTTDSTSQAYDMQDMVVLATITPTMSETTTTTTSTTTTTGGGTYTSSSNGGCNNGLGNGSEGCTPGNARPNDEIVRDAAGNITCTPAPGNPCTQASKQNGK